MIVSDRIIRLLARNYYLIFSSTIVGSSVKQKECIFINQFDNIKLTALIIYFNERSKRQAEWQDKQTKARQPKLLLPTNMVFINGGIGIHIASTYLYEHSLMSNVKDLFLLDAAMSARIYRFLSIIYVTWLIELNVELAAWECCDILIVSGVCLRLWIVRNEKVSVAELPSFRSLTENKRWILFTANVNQPYIRN